jgi:DNA repair exonuclease SbcCD ATPase subunit
MHPSDLAARISQLQAELGRSESQNKLLASSLQQKDRELSALRQQKAQLQRATAQAGGPPASTARPTFAVAELQRQLESAQTQLAFKATEVGAACLVKAQCQQ